jgi:hypothetical protein
MIQDGDEWWCVKCDRRVEVPSNNSEDAIVPIEIKKYQRFPEHKVDKKKPRDSLCEITKVVKDEPKPKVTTRKWYSPDNKASESQRKRREAEKELTINDVLSLKVIKDLAYFDKQYIRESEGQSPVEAFLATQIEMLSPDGMIKVLRSWIYSLRLIEAGDLQKGAVLALSSLLEFMEQIESRYSAAMVKEGLRRLS